MTRRPADRFHHANLRHLLCDDRIDGVDHQKQAERQRQHRHHAQDHGDAVDRILRWMGVGIDHLGEEHGRADLLQLGFQRIDGRIRRLRREGRDLRPQARVAARVKYRFGHVFADEERRIAAERRRLDIDVFHDAGDFEFVLPLVDQQADRSTGRHAIEIDRRPFDHDAIFGRPFAADQFCRVEFLAAIVAAHRDRGVTPRRIRRQPPARAQSPLAFHVREARQTRQAIHVVVGDDAVQVNVQVRGIGFAIAADHTRRQQIIHATGHAHCKHADGDAQHGQQGAALAAPQVAQDLAKADPHEAASAPAGGCRSAASCSSSRSSTT